VKFIEKILQKGKNHGYRQKERATAHSKQVRLKVLQERNFGDFYPLHEQNKLDFFFFGGSD